MPTFLHLLKGDSAPLAIPIIEASSREPNAKVTVVLLDGTMPPVLPPTVLVRRLSPSDLDYSGLLDLIFQSDRVISW
jgi:hypothetical protein